VQELLTCNVHCVHCILLYEFLYCAVLPSLTGDLRTTLIDPTRSSAIYLGLRNWVASGTKMESDYEASYEVLSQYIQEKQDYVDSVIERLGWKKEHIVENVRAANNLMRGYCTNHLRVLVR